MPQSDQQQLVPAASMDDHAIEPVRRVSRDGLEVHDPWRSPWSFGWNACHAYGQQTRPKTAMTCGIAPASSSARSSSCHCSTWGAKSASVSPAACFPRSSRT
jgi:hypothetical protein